MGSDWFRLVLAIEVEVKVQFHTALSLFQHCVVLEVVLRRESERHRSACQLACVWNSQIRGVV